MFEINESPFRAYDKHRKFMAYGMSQEVGEKYELLVGEYITPFVVKIGIMNDSLMRGTGHPDKNGRQIYEGDYVKGVNFRDEEGVWLIRYCEAMAKFTVHKDIEDLINYVARSEVIGNLFENPELERML